MFSKFKEVVRKNPKKFESIIYLGLFLIGIFIGQIHLLDVYEANCNEHILKNIYFPIWKEQGKTNVPYEDYKNLPLFEDFNNSDVIQFNLLYNDSKLEVVT